MLSVMLNQVFKTSAFGAKLTFQQLSRMSASVGDFHWPPGRKMIASRSLKASGSAGMLTCLQKRFRRWAATALVAIYALGILGPAAAFAHADTASIVHVLIEAHGGFLTPHFHNDGRDHDHSKKTKADQGHQCCGVTSISGLEPDADISLVALPLVTTVAWPTEQRISDYTLDRLDRPPRQPLPF
jgi:hypothetical protein